MRRNSLTRNGRFLIIVPLALLLFSLVWQIRASAQTPSVVFNGGNTHNGTETFDNININKVIYWDGSMAYPFTTVGLQAAINASCNGTVPGKVVLPPFPANGVITAQINVPSLCWIDGAGKYSTVLQASGSLNTDIIGVGPSAHVRLTNFGIDGNRSDNSGTNAYTFHGVDVGVNASDIVLDGMRVSNVRDQGIWIINGTSHVVITNCEIDHVGTLSGSAYGVNIFSNASPGIVDIRIGPNNMLHDNLGGTFIETAANNVSGVSIYGNTMYANAGDANLILGQASAGVISGFRGENNELYCNGWPPSGIGFPAACTPGFLQTGSVSSGGGVGFDLIQNADRRIVHPIISGNYIHDNVFEGVALTTNINPVVNTNGTGVTWVSGPLFNTNWKAGQTVFIGPTNNSTSFFKIASVASTTSLTLTSSAGVQTATSLLAPSYMWASVTSNQFVANGFGSGGPGPGLYVQFSDGNSFGQNVYRGNSNSGFISFGANFNSVNGDAAYSNYVTSGSNAAGFVNLAGLGNSYENVIADDPQASPKQVIGLLVDAHSTNTSVISQSLYGTTAPVSNSGVAMNTPSAKVKSSFTTPCTNGELALSIGWQSTGSATVTGAVGTGQTCEWTITTGTTTSANPTITDNLTNALPSALTVCEMNIKGGTRAPAASDSIDQTTLSATAPKFTFQGTPTAGGKTYTMVRRCGP
jgi:hypothetical protein